MCNLNNIIEPASLDVENLENSIQEYMSKISQVKVDVKRFSAEELVESFRDGFGIEEHNYLNDNADSKGILCYDLMICENPLDEIKKQRFYTFFSLNRIKDVKLKYAQIYQYYLDTYPDLHIDTMLQICYSGDIEKKKAKDKYNIIKDGFYLKFDSEECKLFAFESNELISSFKLCSNRISDCEAFMDKVIRKDTLDKNDIEWSIDSIEQYIEKMTIATSDENSNYHNYVNAFLDIRNTNKDEKDKNITQKQIHKNVYRVSLINELAVPGIKSLYFIPLSFPNGSQIGHFVLSTKGDYDTDKVFVKRFRILSFTLMFPLSQANMSSVYIRKANAEAIKSAKAAIMSRNMSHNIGSHVMSYLKQHLSSVKDIVSDGILCDLIKDEGELNKQLNNTSENTTLPFLMGMGHFVSYLQERQDFIATIATDYIPYFGNVNFKDSIYDELNPDKRALRHSDRKNGATDNILLGNIARSEGLGRQTSPTLAKTDKAPLNDIVLKFQTQFDRNPFDGNPVVVINDSGNIEKVLDEQAKGELDKMRKIDFSLPGGIVGRQAFFSILENIIRNAAKHGNWRSKNNLELTFNIFSSKEDDVKRLNKYDNDNVDEHSLTLKEVITNYYLNAIDSNDLYFVTITDNCTVVTNNEGEQTWDTLGKLRFALASQYITNTGEMDGTNKGLKEIRISSAWLRAIHDESECFDPYDKNANYALLVNDRADDNDKVWKKVNTKKKAPLIYARISAEKGMLGLLKKSNLQYIICVQIPRKVALVLNDDNYISAIQANMERINWRAYNKKDFINERNKSFEFILIDDQCESYDGSFDEIRQVATARTFCFSEIIGLDRDSFLSELKDDKYTGEEDLALFYKTLSQCQGVEKIVIDDKVVSEREKKKINTEESCFDNIHICDGYKERGPVYIYRRHHEADKEFTDFMLSNMKTFFVEGITGSNSTDRLVRNETLNELWFYRHLHAMKQSVAIFDERLFHKITGLEEKDLKVGNAKLCKDSTALAYLQKGIYPFTFVEDENNKDCYYLKGVIFDNDSPITEIRKVKDDAQSPINTYYCKCDTLAVLSFIDGKLIVNPSSMGDYMKKRFDFMTIHQGLLDKLYEKFNIKDKKDAKIVLTKALFDKFSCKLSLTNDFLPGVIIHSGRSKPNNVEMPQKFPFIQFAALEHAVMDCKYSLVELLDFARYEE